MEMNTLKAVPNIQREGDKNTSGGPHTRCLNI